ncbi:hypothetical protein AX774_g7802 [Zancudomyces culisetae]|uniref:Uncharacterized protein n=1 Tax=Zancudomyces culisetae TaxID=1213189 RepID=A0A1R1PCU9_ZANCU|nr:hypothetical protein AX774_g7802 [Zancudomyces culisetae]|eukprot:OMH78807.1 hypothetical protein AX774_g7802 [Zancudomyces culisetae]
MLHQKPESAKNYSEAIANNGNNQLKVGTAPWCCLVDKTLQANNDTKVQTWDGFFEQNEIIEASEDISFNVIRFLNEKDVRSVI